MPVRSVLVVDDSAVIRKAVSELFARELDFEVCAEAENGREAIEKALLLNPDLIVTDVSMPLMDGIEETRRLKQMMPRVPVIVFTGHDNRFIEKEAMSAGASAMVPKSEAAAVLIGKARELLDKIDS